MDKDATQKRRIDVQSAFAAEPPTLPVQVDAHLLSRTREADPAADAADAVHALVPLDAVPVLAVERADMPWSAIGHLATQLLLRVDGCTCTMWIVTGASCTPYEGARELGALVRRGLVRLTMPRAADDEDAPVLEVERVSLV